MVQSDISDVKPVRSRPTRGGRQIRASGASLRAADRIFPWRGRAGLVVTGVEVEGGWPGLPSAHGSE
jgi:hypothetical protein